MERKLNQIIKGVFFVCVCVFCLFVCFFAIQSLFTPSIVCMLILKVHGYSLQFLYGPFKHRFLSLLLFIICCDQTSIFASGVDLGRPRKRKITLKHSHDVHFCANQRQKPRRLLNLVCVQHYNRTHGLGINLHSHCFHHNSSNTAQQQFCNSAVASTA